MKFTKSGILKVVIGLSAVVLIGLTVLYFAYNEDRPQGKTGPAAEALAQKMLTAINNDAWQEVNYVQWTFPGAHQYLWDKKRHLVQVKWDDKMVLLDPSAVDGVAHVKEKKLGKEEGDSIVKDAWGYFINDSFWLNAPALVNQPGTVRSIVTAEDGDQQLMVTYTSGGDTPGDSYLWKLDANGRPLSYQMWVNIIPIGGMEFTWEGWKEMPNGAMLSSTHQSAAVTLELTDIKTGDNYTEFGLDADPFAPISR